MGYVKAALIATLTAFATLLAVGFLQVWLTGFMLDRELQREIDTKLNGTYGAAVFAAGGDVNLLPAFLAALLAFAAVFVWLVRRQSQRQRST